MGYVVAPTLFYSLADRTLAGAVAGKLFTLIAYIGIVCACYVISFRLLRFGGRCLKHGMFWIVLAMLLLTVAGEFWVQPILAGLKHLAPPAAVMESVFLSQKLW